MITTKGILNARTAEEKMSLARYWPGEVLAPFVERYWIIHWDLPTPHIQETLPYPCVNLVFEPGNTRIWGVMNRKFSRRLENKGMVLGVKFKPGGFYPFWQKPLTCLTDRSLGLEEVFPVESNRVEAELFALKEDACRVAWVEQFLSAYLPAPDDHLTLISQMVDCIGHHPEITRVEMLGQHFHLSKRTLQRLFSQYVGVSPKWVIKRCRLQEAAEQLETGHHVNLSHLALNLGYFDQAHFIKDFKQVIGCTPTDYMAQVVDTLLRV